MNIHYYFYHESKHCGFSKLELRAYLEEKEYSRTGDLRYCFRCIEHLNIDISRDQKLFQCNDFKHHFGAQTAYIHFSHSLFELNEDMKHWGMKPINRRNYERFRKVAIALYQNTGLVNFSDFNGPQQSIGRVIID